MPAEQSESGLEAHMRKYALNPYVNNTPKPLAKCPYCGSAQWDSTKKFCSYCGKDDFKPAQQPTRAVLP